ncbi:MAG TPA: hypothetical protein VN908_00060 [Gemmatimonadales bacterium]|nr:hypothetical protein [Gemmatimonadales bacterium]
MRVGRIVVFGVLLSVCPTISLSAQVSFHFSLGARYSSTLVHDSIVNPIDVRPTIAPTVLLTVRDKLHGPWSADATLDVSPSGLRRHEGGGSFDAGSCTAIALTVGLRRALASRVSGRVAFGGLTYAAQRSGVFRQGNGGVLPAVSVSAAYAPSFGARRGLEIDARYDLHRFITPALRGATFTSPRPVHRIAITVSARILGGGGQP